jgi:hypothetical protein
MAAVSPNSRAARLARPPAGRHSAAAAIPICASRKALHLAASGSTNHPAIPMPSATGSHSGN